MSSSLEVEVISGAEILIRCLQAEKIETIFGYPGGAVLHIYDALCQQSKICHVLVRHEQAAVHAADAYFRSSGKIGVALVTSGPGVTNSVTGIATAYYDSIPLIIISGQVSTISIGYETFQESDAIGITRPCVKHNFLVMDVKDLALIIKKAFYISRSGRPGPVLIDVPINVMTDKTTFHYPIHLGLRAYNPILKPCEDNIRRVAYLLLKSQRPMIYTGGGVILSNASEHLRKLARYLGFPVTNSLMGLGAYPATDKQFLGMPGMYGTYEANMALQYCDVLLAIGVRFDDRVIGNPQDFAKQPRQIIQIEIDPASISKRVKTDIAIFGNVSDVLKSLMAHLEIIGNSSGPMTSRWWKTITKWRNRKCLRYQSRPGKIMPQEVIEKLWNVTRHSDTFITSDVGQHQMFTAQYYKFDRARRWINSGGFGTMGVGLPYAIGVRYANPTATVACVTGEASIQMCIQELSTCKHYSVPVKVINLNNACLGMVRQWQETLYGKRYTSSYMLSLPDFVKLAEAYGHIGMRIEYPEDISPAFELAFSDKYKNNLVFMDFAIDATVNVLPMVSSGKGLADMVLADNL